MALPKHGVSSRLSLVERAPAQRNTASRDGIRAILMPSLLSISLVVAVVFFAIASYPLWPRMYLSPVLDLYPPLAAMLLDLFSTNLAHRLVDVTNGNVIFYGYALSMFVLFGAYFAALHYVRGIRPSTAHLRWVIAVTALIGLLLLFAPTLFTSDIYSYVIYGRIASAYGGNPLVTPPNKFPFDPVFPFVYWKDTVSVYGPVWLDLSYVLMATIPAVVSSQIASFKLVAIVFHLANAVVVWHILQRLAPRNRLFGTVLYAWNPLLMIEFLANGHNDVVMVFFMLLALLFIVRGNRSWPVVFLTLAILTKWVAGFVLPIYLLAVWREEIGWWARWRFLSTSGGIAAAIVAVLYAPYWAGPVSFTAMFDSAAFERFINSFPELVVKPLASLLRDWLPRSIPRDILTENMAGYVIKAVLGLVFAGFWLKELKRRSSSMRMIEPWLRTLFAYLVLACVWFWPWYISWLLPFAALHGKGRLTKATLLFSFSGAFFYSLWPGAPLRPFEPFYDLRALALFGLPLSYLIGSALIDRAKVSLMAPKTEYRKGDL